MQFIGCLFSLLLLGIVLVLSFGLSIISFFLQLFGIKMPGPKHEEPTTQPPNETQRQRVFEDGEGEYVDFEEV